MRQIGSLATEEDAHRFRDFLFIREVKATVEPDGDQWAVWVYDEDRLPAARDELAQFVADPRHERYRDAVRQAERLRAQEQKRQEKIRKANVNVRERWERPVTSRLPVVTTLILLSLAVTIGSGFGEQVEPFLQYTLLAEVTDANVPLRPGLTDVFRGQLWRLVTPIFAHFGFLHIAGNCYWLFLLGSAMETNRGSLRLALLVLGSAIFSNLVQYVMTGSVWFGGMSGVVFALFGYMWMKSSFQPELGLFLPQQIVFWMMLWFVLCFSNLVGPIANGAHAGGLIAGLAVGIAPVFWRNLTRP